MQTNNMIPALINRAKGVGDNQAIRKELYKILGLITEEYRKVLSETPALTFQNNSEQNVIHCYGQRCRADAIWKSRDLVLDAIEEQSKLIKNQQQKQFKK